MNKDLGLNPWLTLWTKPRTTIQALVAYDVNYHFVLLCAMYGLQYMLHTFQFFSTGNAHSFVLTLLAAILLATPVGYIIFNLETVVFFLVGKLLRGRGSFKQIRSAICWSKVPIVCTLAIWGILMIIYGNDLFIAQENQRIHRIDMVTDIIIAILQITAAIWSLVLLVYMLSEVQGLSAWMALLNIILSGVAMFLLLFLANWGMPIIGRHI